MHLLEGPDKGHSLIYCDGTLEKKRLKKLARWDSNPQPHEHEVSALPLRYNSSPSKNFSWVKPAF